ncbi:hypothetical protein CVS40_12787 [Lucilia cuprina]|nr:hypothetical protein CVS40_12787 [Lucilia cuprina]
MDTCRKCGRRHHTLLHPGIQSRVNRQKFNNSRPKQQQHKSSNNHQHQAAHQRILSEAIRSLAQVLCSQPNTTAAGGGSVQNTYISYKKIIK